MTVFVLKQYDDAIDGLVVGGVFASIQDAVAVVRMLWSRVRWNEPPSEYIKYHWAREYWISEYEVGQRNPAFRHNLLWKDGVIVAVISADEEPLPIDLHDFKDRLTREV